MKRFFILPIIALAGCNQQTGSTIIKVIDDVQTAAITSCKFVPTATTIANIISAGSTATPSAIANSVCTAINSMPLAAVGITAPPAVIVNGTPITVEGHRI